MRKLLHTTIVILVLGAPAGALAQRPSVSLVMDSRGSVYYSDLSNVWRISPTGHRSIVVLAVHARQLYLDPEDRLFGEDLSTNDITGQPFHRIWRLR
jgi:hypothetical protein